MRTCAPSPQYVRELRGGGVGVRLLALAARGHERGHRVGVAVATHNERRDLERQRREVLRVVNLRVLATQERSTGGEDGEGAALRVVVDREERTLGGSRGGRHAEEAATVQRLHVVAVVQLQRVLGELLKVDREVLRTGSDTSAKVRVLKRAQNRDLATLRRELDNRVDVGVADVVTTSDADGSRVGQVLREGVNRDGVAEDVVVARVRDKGSAVNESHECLRGWLGEGSVGDAIGGLVTPIACGQVGVLHGSRGGSPVRNATG